MKSILLLAILTTITIISYGQNQTYYDEVYSIIEEPPTFPGGEKALYDYLKKHTLAYSDSMSNKKTIVRFIVEKDGTISEARVVRTIDPILDSISKQIIERMPPWNPGKHEGRYVRSYYTLPVLFRLP